MATAIKIKCLPKPELQFSNGRRDLDPRRALAANGPADHRGIANDPRGLDRPGGGDTGGKRLDHEHGGLQASPRAKCAALSRLAG
jgi:hypothetical protein